MQTRLIQYHNTGKDSDEIIDFAFNKRKADAWKQRNEPDDITRTSTGTLRASRCPTLTTKNRSSSHSTTASCRSNRSATDSSRRNERFRGRARRRTSRRSRSYAVGRADQREGVVTAQRAAAIRDDRQEVQNSMGTNNNLFFPYGQFWHRAGMTRSRRRTSSRSCRKSSGRCFRRTMRLSWRTTRQGQARRTAVRRRGRLCDSDQRR